MSSARIGVPPAMPCVWSAAQTFDSESSRGERFTEHALRRAAAAAQRLEIDLVQQHGVGRDQLLALQPVQDEARRRARIEARQLASDSVETPNSTAVVVLVVTGEQPRAETVQSRWLETDRSCLESHFNLRDTAVSNH